MVAIITLIVCAVLIVGLTIIGLILVNRMKRVTWTDLEVMRYAPNQDTFYKCLNVEGERFLFTVEQVNVARQRAQDLAPHLPRTRR